MINLLDNMMMIPHFLAVVVLLTNFYVLLLKSCDDSSYFKKKNKQKTHESIISLQVINSVSVRFRDYSWLFACVFMYFRKNG